MRAIPARIRLNPKSALIILESKGCPCAARSSRIILSATTAQVAWQSSPPCANARSYNVRSACGAPAPMKRPKPASHCFPMRFRDVCSVEGRRWAIWTEAGEIKRRLQEIWPNAAKCRSMLAQLRRAYSVFRCRTVCKHTFVSAKPRIDEFRHRRFVTITPSPTSPASRCSLICAETVRRSPQPFLSYGPVGMRHP